MAFSFKEFRNISNKARSERTEEAAIALLAIYAKSGCATYPADSAIFTEVWPTGNPPGFTLHPYMLPGSHTVSTREN